MNDRNICYGISFLPSCVLFHRQTDYGFIQQSSFQNLDVYHEEVDEVDVVSLWAPKYASDTETVSYVLVGDQNAGKSTFCHAFTHSDDSNFMLLCSHLHMLQSRFTNMRMVKPGYVVQRGTATSTDNMS